MSELGSVIADRHAAAPEVSLASELATHDFLGVHHDRHARRARGVLLLCLVAMAIQLVGGAFFHSMALVADGLHMATHAGVMFVAAAAYRYARQHLGDRSFAFGTGKVGDLAAFASAVTLGATALFIAVESVGRLLEPVAIVYDQAIGVAIFGLLVNLASIWLLRDDHGHHHHGREAHGHDAAAHHDHNIRAAYVHVLSDTAVGVLAIVSLLLGRQFGWRWLDPLAGLVGALVIGSWSLTLARATAAVLLDRVPDERLAARALHFLGQDGARVLDFHMWRLGPGHNGVVASVAGLSIEEAAARRTHLSTWPTISHVTIEVLPWDARRR